MRNVPSHTGFAPLQSFVTRVMCTKLPVLPELCLVNAVKTIKGAEARKVAHQKLCERQGGKELKALVPGQHVLVQQLCGFATWPQWDNCGTVVSQNEDR